MPVSPAALVSLYGAPLVAGAGLLRWIGVRVRKDPLAFIGWSYVCGVLLTGALLGIWLVLGWPLRAAFLAPTLCVGGLLLLGTARRAKPSPPVQDERRFPWFEELLVPLVLLGAIASQLEISWVASRVPILLGDEAAIWSAKAKALFVAAGFNERLRVFLADSSIQHPDYPILNPLLQVWAFAHAGEITHAFNRLPLQGLAVALLLILAGALRRHVRPALAAALLLILAGQVTGSSGLAHSRFADADLMIAVGFLVAVDACLRYLAHKDLAWWRLFALALAFLVASKQEGLLLAVALWLAWLFAASVGERSARAGLRVGRSAVWLLGPPAIVALTWGFNLSMHLENDMISGHGSGGLFSLVFTQFGERFPRVFKFFAEEVYLNASRTRLAVACFLGLLLVFPRRAGGGTLLVPTVALLLGLAGYQLALIGSHQPLEWHLATAGERLVNHMVPAIVVWIAAASARLFPGLSARQEAAQA
jgi:hypothetical protein